MYQISWGMSLHYLKLLLPGVAAGILGLPLKVLHGKRFRLSSYCHVRLLPSIVRRGTGATPHRIGKTANTLLLLAIFWGSPASLSPGRHRYALPLIPSLFAGIRGRGRLLRFRLGSLYWDVLSGRRLGLLEEAPVRSITEDAVPLAAGYLFEKTQGRELFHEAVRGPEGDVQPVLCQVDVGQRSLKEEVEQSQSVQNEPFVLEERAVLFTQPNDARRCR